MNYLISFTKKFPIKWILLASVIVGLLFTCHKMSLPTSNGMQTYTVQAETRHNLLYFTGTFLPLRETSLTNALDGVIEEMNFHYGQGVKKGQVVFTLNSSELQKQYNDTLTEYLKAKDSYAMAKAKFIGTEDLWQSGLMAKNNYLSEKSSLNSAHLALMQATRKLTELLEKTGGDSYANLSSLSFKEFDKVRQALSSKHNLIYIKAPADGVLLYPPKTGADSGAHPTVGSSVKAAQVLGLIGNMQGVRVEIEVPEVDIDKIKVGMPAHIKSVAYPDDLLQGELVAINAEASTGANGALPSFTAIVEVNQLTPRQQAWVKVGMSAAIELNMDSGAKLMVPIAAIKQVHGQKVVELRDKSGQTTTHVIITGPAEVDKVVIESGLKAGDVVVYG